MEMRNDLNQKWIVYQTICTVNNKIYIGVHKTNNPDVFDGYIGNGFSVGYMIKNPKTAYAKALKKYGYDKFKRSTIKIFDNEDDAYALEAELVNLDFVKRRDTYNTSIGGKKQINYKSFYQYDLNGAFIKEWPSRESLIKHYNFENDVNKIHRAVVNKWSVFDSFWTIEYFDKLDVSEYRINKFTSIYKFNRNGDQVAVYDNAIKASEAEKISLNSIYGAINKKTILCDHFYTKDPNDIFNIIKSYDDKSINDNCISIYKNDELEKTFKNMKETSKFLNVTYKDIKKAIINSSEINGYKISYGFNKTYSNKQKPGLQIEQYDLNGNLIKIWNTLSECAKEHPKVRLVLKGVRNHTHGYTFKIKG